MTKEAMGRYLAEMLLRLVNTPLSSISELSNSTNIIKK